MKIFLALLFLTSVGSTLWLIQQYSSGRKALFKMGLVAIFVWLVGLAVVAAVSLWIVLAAIPGHTPDSLDFYSSSFLVLSAIWSVSIFPYLLITGWRHSNGATSKVDGIDAPK